MSKGTIWESNFEDDFTIDNDIHYIVSSLKNLKPLGSNLNELSEIIRFLFRKRRKPSDLCKFYDLDDLLHRKLLLLILSLLIRSPSGRAHREGYSQMIGLPPDEETGKANIFQDYRTATSLCENCRDSRHFFVLIHSPLKRFIFGDGMLDWLTTSLSAGRIEGRALVPLTPHLCVYFCTPYGSKRQSNCASLIAAPWMVNYINEITQIHSKEKLFFLGKAPVLSDAFRQGKFLWYGERSDYLIDILDDIAGHRKPTPIHGFGIPITWPLE